MENNGWSLRREFVFLIRKWYLIAALFLAGAAAGWLIGAVIPAAYEARAGLKVSFNSDAVYLTPDDYKNWQMEELEDLVLSDAVLAETQVFLVAKDPGWASWTVEELRSVVVPRWRNAGVWNLSATLSDPVSAEQLAGAWRAASLNVVEHALAGALAFDRLDRQLDSLSRELAEVQTGLTLLEEVVRDLNQLQAQTAEPETGQRAEQIYERLQRIPLLEAGETDFPGRDAAETELAAWAAVETGRTFAILEELAELESGLLEEYDQTGAAWLVEKDASAGLSAYLSVGMPAESAVRVETHAASGLLALAGGVSAVLVWFALRLVRTGMQENRTDERTE